MAGRDTYCKMQSADNDSLLPKWQVQNELDHHASQTQGDWFHLMTDSLEAMEMVRFKMNQDWGENILNKNCEIEKVNKCSRRTYINRVLYHGQILWGHFQWIIIKNISPQSCFCHFPSKRTKMIMIQCRIHESWYNDLKVETNVQNAFQLNILTASQADTGVGMRHKKHANCIELPNCKQLSDGFKCTTAKYMQLVQAETNHNTILHFAIKNATLSVSQGNFQSAWIFCQGIDSHCSLINHITDAVIGTGLLPTCSHMVCSHNYVWRCKFHAILRKDTSEAEMGVWLWHNLWRQTRWLICCTRSRYGMEEIVRQ